MVIPQRFREEMIAHAREGSPEEVCGLLAADRSGRIERLYRITNSEHSPRFYAMDSQEQLKALLDMEASGLDIAAVYHSHPATEPVPSSTDIKLAAWPGIRYIIVSLRDEEAPELRAWTIEDAVVAEDNITTE